MEKNYDALMQMVEAEDLHELYYRATECWDDEDQKHEGLSDIEYLIRETEWLIEDFCEDTGHCLHDDYMDAKALIRRTDNGKRRPIDITTMSIMIGYRDHDIQRARNIIEEVKRTKAFLRKLRRINK